MSWLKSLTSPWHHEEDALDHIDTNTKARNSIQFSVNEPIDAGCIFPSLSIGQVLFNFRVVGWYCSFFSYFKRNLCLQTVDNLIKRLAASSDLVLHCLSMSHKMDARLNLD